MSNISKTTRAKLYAEVWAESTVAVAKRYGISSVGLAKICRLENIPVPSRGWHTKRRAGKQVAQTPLPPAVDAEIVFRVSIAPDPSEGAEKAPAPPAVADPEFLRELDIARRREIEPAWRIVVPRLVKLSHPYAKQAHGALRKAAAKSPPLQSTIGYQGSGKLFVRTGPRDLSIIVAEQRISRALRLMQALLLAFEARGFAFDRVNSGVVVLGIPFRISIKESVGRRPNADGKRVGPFIASGQIDLSFSHEEFHGSEHDDVENTIEMCLNRFISRMVEAAFAVRCSQEARADRIRRWRAEDDRARKVEQSRATERLRQRHVYRLAAAWSRRERLLAFVQAAKRRINATQTSEALEWAERHLAASDPVGTLLAERLPSAELPPPAPMPWNFD